MTENENKNKSSLWWKRGFVIAFAIIVIFFVVYSTFYNFKLSYELLAILALLLFLIIYDDVKEISIGSILSIKKEVEKVAKEQEKLATIITTLTINQKAEQNVNIQVPEKEYLSEKEDDIGNKKLIRELINQNKEYYSYLKQWEEYSKQQNQTVQGLQKEIEQAKGFIENLIIRKEIADFNYLNYFLVYNTKRLLHWLVGVNTVTIADVHIQALIMGINQNNIQTTIEVLRDNYMIAVENGNITSTPRAKRFLNFIEFGKKPSDELISKLLNDYLSKSK